MLKILRKSGEVAPEEQFLLISTIFCYLMFGFCVKTRIIFSLRDKRLFEITEVEITRVDCISKMTSTLAFDYISLIPAIIKSGIKSLLRMVSRVALILTFDIYFMLC